MRISHVGLVEYRNKSSVQSMLAADAKKCAAELGLGQFRNAQDAKAAIWEVLRGGSK